MIRPLNHQPEHRPVAAHTELAVIVSQAMQKKFTYFDRWMASGFQVWTTCCTVHTAIRVGLIKLAGVRRSGQWPEI